MADKSEDNTKGQKKKKKNRNKERKRLQSLFRGPKTEQRLYRELTDSESMAFKQTLIDIIKTNQIKLDPKKSIKELKNSKNETKTNDSNKLLKNDLMFGLNSVIRGIEKKSVIGLILTNPLALPLEDNIIELSTNNEIPCLSVQSLHELKTCLNISSLSAIAFRPNVTSKESIFHEFYENFKQIVDRNCVLNQSIETTDPEIEKEVEEKPREDSVEAKRDNESTSVDIIEKNLFNVLYIKKCDDNYRDLMSNFRNKTSKPTKDEFSSQQSMIRFSSVSDIDFPETEDLNINLPKIDVIFDEQPMESNDNSFAQSLIDSSEESPNKSLKRKSSLRNNPSLNFKNPRIERLEPSIERIKTRKERKQMKKQKKLTRN